MRDNILRTILSGIIAIERGGISHATRKLGLVAININPEELISKIDRKSKETDLFRKKICKTKNYIEVSYEGFVANRDEEGRKITDFLNIVPYKNLSTKLVKQNVYSLQQIIENYDEVIEYAKKTRYRVFF